MRGDVVLSTEGLSGLELVDFLYAVLDHTPVGFSVGDFNSLIAFWTSS